MYRIFWLLLLLVACQSGSDSTPPTVASSIPAGGATDIASNTKLAIAFSEAMKQDSITISATPNINLGTAVWNDAKTVVFSPGGGWQAGTTYSLNIEAKDLAGNPLSGNKTLSFKTQEPLDTTAPAVPSGIKATGEDGGFSVEWDANTEADLAGYTVYFGLSTTALDNSVTVNKPDLKTRIGGLENSKTYFFAVDAYDHSGNHSGKSAVGSVVPKDLKAPTLISSEPASGAADLVLVPRLRLSFSEPMDKNSLAVGLCIGTDPPASAVCSNPLVANLDEPNWQAGDTAVQYTPPSSTFAPGKTYVLVISAKDKTGNALASGKIAFSLQAAPDTTAPTVLGSDYNLNSLTHSLSINLHFSEPMNQQSVEQTFLSQPLLGCEWTWEANKATCRVTSGLAEHTNYTIILGAAATDSAGNPTGAAYQTLVIVGNLSPRLLSVVPRSGAGRISPLAPLTFTFSEPMNHSSTQEALEIRIGNNQFIHPGSLTWNPQSTELKFTPSTPYGDGVAVNWTLFETAKDAEGARLPRASGNFTTLFVIGPATPGK